MKQKRIVILAALLASLSLTQSCNKFQLGNRDHKGTETQEVTDINVNLKYGETYTYTLPSNQSDDPYAITQQATHYTSSELNTNNTVYTYVAAQSVAATPYTDSVTIANVEETHTGHPSGVGTCSGSGHHHENEVERTIHIHFTVGSIVSGAKTSSLGSK